MSKTAAKMTESRSRKSPRRGLDDLRKRIGVPITDTLEP